MRVVVPPVGPAGRTGLPGCNSLATLARLAFVLAVCVAVLSTAVVTPLAAQVTSAITGRVADQTRAGIAGATVVIERGPGLRRETTADAEGKYHFAAVEPGTYTVTVSAARFQSVRTDVVVAVAGLAKDFVLEVQPIEDSVVVIGDAVDAVRTEAAANYNRNKAVTTLDRETVINNSPVANYESLRLLPGVMSAGAKDRFSTPSHLRGAGAWGQVEQVDDYPAINITPVSAEDGGYTASFSSIIPSIALTHLTLATGGLGVSYGQASGGIVRSGIKRGSRQGPHTTLRAEGMGIGEGVAMADTGGVIGKVDLYAAGQTVYADYGDAYDTFARPIEGLRLASGLAKAGYRVSDNSRAELLVVGGDESHDYFQVSTEAGSGRSLRRDYHTEKSNYFTAARFDLRPSSNLVLGAGVTHSRFHENRIEDTLNGASVDLSRRNRPQHATRVFANMDWSASPAQGVRYTGSGGVDATWDEYRDITTTPITFEFAEQSAFWRNSLAFDGGLVVNGGVRLAAVDNGFETTHPLLFDAGAAYQLPTKTRLMASYSTGYKLNKAFYLWWGSGQFIGRAGTEGLRPSRTRTAEVGVQQDITRGTRALGHVRVSLFSTDEVDLFNFGNTGNGVPFYDDARARGLEVWSELRFAKVRPFASFTWLRTERTASTNPAAPNVDLRFTPLPNYAASAGAHFDLFDRLSLSVMGYYDDGGVSEQVVTDAIAVTRFEAFVKANAAAAYRINNRLSLSLRIENLFNQRDLGYSRSVLNPDGTSQRVVGTQRDPGTIVGGGLQVRF